MEVGRLVDSQLGRIFETLKATLTASTAFLTIMIAIVGLMRDRIEIALWPIVLSMVSGLACFYLSLSALIHLSDKKDSEICDEKNPKELKDETNKEIHDKLLFIRLSLLSMLIFIAITILIFIFYQFPVQIPQEATNSSI